MIVYCTYQFKFVCDGLPNINLNSVIMRLLSLN